MHFESGWPPLNELPDLLKSSSFLGLGLDFQNK